MKKIRFMPALTVLALLLSGCDVDSPLSLMLNPPRCSLSVAEKLISSRENIAIVKLLARNTTQATAYNVGCSINCIYNYTIVERSSAYFGTLYGGQSATSDAWLGGIRSHRGYDWLEITLYWEDAEGEFYDAPFVLE